VTEKSWYWNDPGSVLFDRNKYRMLCRVIDPRLTEVASATYLGGIMRSIDERLGETVDAMESVLLESLRAGYAGTQKHEEGKPEPALSEYSKMLSDATGDAGGHLNESLATL